MLLELDHPAIVPRRVRHPEDPAFALVRMTSAIHVEEYSSREVGTAVIMQHPIGTTAYRKIGAHLYKEVGGMPLKALENGSDLMATLLGREHFDFGTSWRISAMTRSSFPGTRMRSIGKSHTSIGR
jgi:hypothetical protein